MEATNNNPFQPYIETENQDINFLTTPPSNAPDKGNEKNVKSFAEVIHHLKRDFWSKNLASYRFCPPGLQRQNTILALRTLIRDIESIVIDPTQMKYRPAFDTLTKTYNIALKQDIISRLIDNDDEKKTALQRLSDDIKNELKGLNDRGKCLIPIGTKEHAIAMEVTCKIDNGARKYDVKIFDSDCSLSPKNPWKVLLTVAAVLALAAAVGIGAANFPFPIQVSVNIPLIGLGSILLIILQTGALPFRYQTKHIANIDGKAVDDSDFIKELMDVLYQSSWNDFEDVLENFLMGQGHGEDVTSSSPHTHKRQFNEVCAEKCFNFWLREMLGKKDFLEFKIYRNTQGLERLKQLQPIVNQFEGVECKAPIEYTAPSIFKRIFYALTNRISLTALIGLGMKAADDRRQKLARLS